MNAIDLYQVWATEGATWSPWVKPVLFAAWGGIPSSATADWEEARTRARTLWAPQAMGETVLVLDLAGPTALALALECAAHGWRPVPLFNSCPGGSAWLDNEPIRAGLVEGAPVLRGFSLAESAAPAFVLDSRRTDGKPVPESFDNRWVVFPQDFPSAAFLLSRGLGRALLVQDGRREPRADLAHVLLRWQQAGLEIAALDLAHPTAPEPIRIAKPFGFRAFGYRALVALGLRKNSAGGFGAIVPPLFTGGGGGGMWA